MDRMDRSDGGPRPWRCSDVCGTCVSCVDQRWWRCSELGARIAQDAPEKVVVVVDSPWNWET